MGFRPTNFFALGKVFLNPFAIRVRLSRVSKSSALFAFVSFRRWQSTALDTTIGGFFVRITMGYQTFKFKMYDNAKAMASASPSSIIIFNATISV